MVCSMTETKTTNLWKRLFGKKEEAKPVEEVFPTIEIGERYLLAPKDGDPFGQQKFYPVTVMDVKEGWVRYDMLPTFPDCRKPIKSFLAMYRKVS